MSIAAEAVSRPDVHRIQQVIKWTVYTLLIVNFVFYVFEDWNRAMHTLHAGSTLLDVTSEFATTLDELAWFVLLFMFELETYVLEDEDWKGWVARTVRGLRVLCYALITHTVYAYAVTLVNLQPTVAVEDVSDLCSLSAADLSYVYNLEYTAITDETCGTLSSASEFYRVASDPAITDGAGLGLERDLALADVVEALAWLVILLAIEVIVRLQDRGVTGSTLISTLNSVKVLLYASILGLGIYWASLSHWLYLWDELLWVCGFAAIEMNVSEWRTELLGKQQSEAA